MSEPFVAREALDWTGGRLARGSAEECFRGVCIDSRAVAAGDLFVAIAGERHDGHDFAEAAVAAGASGLLVAGGRPLGELPARVCVIEVADTTRGLGALAAGHRASFAGPLVAITGSNGKTSTKEMCAAILGVAAPCLKNAGNLNNHWGLPLSLLRREPEHESVVVEIGMNHRGEIAPLAAIARPSVGVITNVGMAHIENLGSQEEIALEKGDLVASLDPGAVAVLNADDPRVLAQGERCAARILRFGEAREADVRPQDLRRREGVGIAFTLIAAEGRIPVEVDGLGAATLWNALAASAAALAAGASLDQVAEGLARHRPIDGRLERRELIGGGVLLNDSYNANPQSLAVALQVLAELPGPGRRYAVLGDMGELGARAPEAHEEAGRRVGELGIDALLALGEHGPRVVAAAVAAGLSRDAAHAVRDHQEAIDRLRARLEKGDCVLVKGSRSMRMEKIARALSEEDR